MLELIKKDMHLYVKVHMNLRLPIPYQTKLFDTKERNMLLLPDEVMHILAKNGNIRFWNGQKYIKLNLGQFYDIMQRQDYKIVDFVEPKKEMPKQQPQQPQQPKAEKVEVKEEPKVEPVKEEPKQQPKVEPKKEDYKQNENKKQRHNNNNNNNNKQGGDK